MTQGPLSLTQDLRADWKDQAACGGYPNTVFFPGSDAPVKAVERAQAICAVCVVAENCLEYAFETNQRSGIWAGTTEDERRSLRRKWLAARRRSS